MLRLLVLLPLFSLFAACGSDDNSSPAMPPPPITVFKNWVKESPKSQDSIEVLSSFAESAEKTGEVPSFFVKASLLTREDRDNVQNGYIYPLYFATKTYDFPSRHWNDGYTVKKSHPSDTNEAKKIQGIFDEMVEFWGVDGYKALFFGLNNYGLIDVRYYSLKPQPPMVAETCFTVRWETGSDGTFNYCFNAHRFLQKDNGTFPQVRWAYNNKVSGDKVEAFKLFVLSLASYEVIFDNPDNRKLRDYFVAKKD